MRILLDNNIHVDLVNDFPGHEVSHCRDLGWQSLLNGEMVRAADPKFDILITVDKNMPHQTSLKGLSLAVVVFAANNNTLWELRRFVPEAMRQIDEFKPGTYSLISIGHIKHEP